MEKWKLKASTKIFIMVIIFAIAIILFFTIIPVLFVKDYNIKEIFIGYIEPILTMIYFATIMFSPVLIVYIITNVIKYKNSVKSQEYYRDIEKQYTPAIASFLVDYKIEGNEGVLATILDLYVKKYLNIREQDKKLEIEILNESTEKLYLHEKYIIDCLKKKELIEIIEFQSKVKKDCVEKKLVNEKDISLNWLKAIKVEVEIAMLFGLLDLFFQQSWCKRISIISFIALVMTFVILFTLKRHARTSKGREVALKFKGLKNFLKEYTLLSERDIDYINLSDRYLPFALTLGVANKLENTYIEYNNLISNYIK